MSGSGAQNTRKSQPHEREPTVEAVWSFLGWYDYSSDWFQSWWANNTLDPHDAEKDVTEEIPLFQDDLARFEEYAAASAILGNTETGGWSEILPETGEEPVTSPPPPVPTDPIAESMKWQDEEPSDTGEPPSWILFILGTLWINLKSRAYASPDLSARDIYSTVLSFFPKRVPGYDNYVYAATMLWQTTYRFTYGQFEGLSASQTLSLMIIQVYKTTNNASVLLRALLGPYGPLYAYVEPDMAAEIQTLVQTTDILNDLLALVRDSALERGKISAIQMRELLEEAMRIGQKWTAENFAVPDMSKKVVPEKANPFAFWGPFSTDD
jgi:hypothetical protein